MAFKARIDEQGSLSKVSALKSTACIFVLEVRSFRFRVDPRYLQVWRVPANISVVLPPHDLCIFSLKVARSVSFSNHRKSPNRQIYLTKRKRNGWSIMYIVLLQNCHLSYQCLLNFSALLRFHALQCIRFIIFIRQEILP